MGQLLRYVAWVRKHHAEPGRSVRGAIVAKAITEDLKLACSGMRDVLLFEYQLSVTVAPLATH